MEGFKSLARVDDALRLLLAHMTHRPRPIEVDIEDSPYICRGRYSPVRLPAI